MLVMYIANPNSANDSIFHFSNLDEIALGQYVLGISIVVHDAA